MNHQVLVEVGGPLKKKSVYIYVTTHISVSNVIPSGFKTLNASS